MLTDCHEINNCFPLCCKPMLSWLSIIITFTIPWWWPGILELCNHLTVMHSDCSGNNTGDFEGIPW